MKNKTTTFEITVWYRYPQSGEVEKDFKIHDIEAQDVSEAVNKAEALYKSLTAIPFHFSHNGERYFPEGITKEDMYWLAKPR